MKYNELPVPVFETGKFFWRKRDGKWTGSADMSDLGHRCGQDVHGSICGNLYNDAVDIGFEVMNPDTGSSQRFALGRSIEPETLEFVSVKDSNIRILLLND
jgi:hypothetical protein